jgi:hypothetical protein
MSRDVHSCTHWLRPRNPPSPIPTQLGLVYEGAIGQPRQTTSLCNHLMSSLYLLVQVLADYMALTGRELNLEEGEIVELIKIGCSGWWFVRSV